MPRQPVQRQQAEHHYYVRSEAYLGPTECPSHPPTPGHLRPGEHHYYGRSEAHLGPTEYPSHPPTPGHLRPGYFTTQCISDQVTLQHKASRTKCPSSHQSTHSYTMLQNLGKASLSNECAFSIKVLFESLSTLIVHRARKYRFAADDALVTL